MPAIAPYLPTQQYLTDGALLYYVENANHRYVTLEECWTEELRCIPREEFESMKLRKVEPERVAA